ncbi:MAG: GFA family protein [Kiloniellaceae bacterium]
MYHHGGCHCGAISIRYESALAPAATEVRACLCSFCRRHGSRAVSDPDGRVILTLHDAGAVQRYRFGLGTADYFLCGRCGVYVAAVLAEGGALYGIAIVNALDEADAFTQAPKPADYSAENEAARRLRRRTRWTPAEIVGAS